MISRLELINEEMLIQVPFVIYKFISTEPNKIGAEQRASFVVIYITTTNLVLQVSIFVAVIISNIKTIQTSSVFEETLTYLIIQAIAWGYLIANLIIELNWDKITDQFVIVINATTVNTDTGQATLIRITLIISEQVKRIWHLCSISRQVIRVSKDYSGITLLGGRINTRIGAEANGILFGLSKSSRIITGSRFISINTRKISTILSLVIKTHIERAKATRATKQISITSINFVKRDIIINTFAFHNNC